MLVICSIVLAIDAGGIGVFSNADVEGKILKESHEQYLVDFSEGVTKYNIMGKKEDYSKVLVEKTKCVKE